MRSTIAVRPYAIARVSLDLPPRSTLSMHEEVRLLPRSLVEVVIA